MKITSETHILWTYHKYDNTYHAENPEGEYLGYLELMNVGRHRHWCWRQEESVWMSPGCLDEVRVKQKELFKNRK